MTFENDFIYLLVKVVLITTCTLGMMSSLTVFCYRTQKVFLIFSVYLLWVTVSSAVLLYLFGFEGIVRGFLITISSPAIFLAYKMDKDSPAQSVFNYATQIVLSLILTMSSLLINTALGGSKLTDLIIRALIYAIVIFLEWRFLRRPFRQLADVIQKGWGVLSLIPVTFCLLLVLVATVPVHYMKRPSNLLYIAGVVVTMLIMYFVVFQSLMWQYHLQMLTHDKDVLQVQVSSMNKQADAVFAAEEKLHILRHDIRHFASVMKACLQEGSVERAASALSIFETAVSSAATKFYCTDYVINSMLASYFEKAEAAGIKTKVNFLAPPSDKIDTTAFAVALANALENALHACEKQDAARSITLKSRIFNGQYLMELMNTCNYTVTFDNNGLPLSKKGASHGIGTRSILAFAKENNAAVFFRLQDNHFILHMMFSLDSDNVYSEQKS